MNYGLTAIETKEEEHVAGSLYALGDILHHDGQWDADLPEYEPQFGDGWDTYGCTVWGTQNAIEMIMSRKYGIKANYSERFTCNLLPLSPPGGSPQTAAECVRKSGLIDEMLLPMAQTEEEFRTPRPMADDLMAKGLEWKAKYAFGHAWLWSGNPGQEERKRKIISALRFSPVGVAVSAWMRDADGLYADEGRPNNHWCVAIGTAAAPDGRECLRVFDSYDQSVKTLHPGHAIGMAKSYSICDQTPPRWYDALSAIFSGIFKR